MGYMEELLRAKQWKAENKKPGIGEKFTTGASAGVLNEMKVEATEKKDDRNYRADLFKSFIKDNMLFNKKNEPLDMSQISHAYQEFIKTGTMSDDIKHVPLEDKYKETPEARRENDYKLFKKKRDYDKSIGYGGFGDDDEGDLFSEDEAEQELNPAIVQRIKELRKTMDDKAIANALRDKGVDPALYGLK